MPAKSNPRNWNDVQTVIATIAIVATLGLWNFFAQPSKTVTAQQVDDPAAPPPTEPPLAMGSTPIPQVKLMFTQIAPQTVVDPQPQNNKKKNKNNNNGGGGTVTQTKTS